MNNGCSDNIEDNWAKEKFKLKWKITQFSSTKQPNKWQPHPLITVQAEKTLCNNFQKLIELTGPAGINEIGCGQDKCYCEIFIAMRKRIIEKYQVVIYGAWEIILEIISKTFPNIMQIDVLQLKHSLLQWFFIMKLFCNITILNK